MAEITVKQVGDFVYVRQPGYSAALDIIRRVDVAAPAAGTDSGTTDFVSIIKCATTEVDDPDVIWANRNVTQDTLNSTSDNTPPIRINNTFLAGGHHIREFILTSASHGLTNTDVGDVGPDGAAKDWVIIEIVDADNIRVAPQNTGTLTEWVMNGVITGDTITFAGAGAYVFTDTPATPHPFPFLQTFNRSYKLDGVAITDLSTAQTGQNFEILESYAVPNCGAILADLIANKPDATPLALNDPAIQAQVGISMSWRFDRFGGRTGIYSFYNHTDYVMGSDDYFGGMQMNGNYRYGTSPNQLWLMYVPDVSAVDGYDLKNKADLSVSPNVTINVSDCDDATNPASHWAQIVAETDETPIFGFVQGYRRNYGLGPPAQRATYCNRLFNFSTSEKMYPAFLSNAVQPAGGETHSVQTYDAYYDMSATPNYTVDAVVEFHDGKVHWIFDCHTTLANEWIALPAELEGYPITVLNASDSFTVHNTEVQSTGLKVSVTGGYGHAVIEVDLMARNNYLSRGAVEPAEASASGNEYQAWRGAIEPQAPAVVATDATMIQVGVGRRGGHAVESQISGFAGFKIHRPKDRPAPAKKPGK